MSKARAAANPINPRRVPRGIAKPDVYRLLELYEQGFSVLEREELEERLGYNIPADEGRRPGAQLIAHRLIFDAGFYDFMGEEPEDAIERVHADLAAGRIDGDQQLALMKVISDQDERDKRPYALLHLTTKQRRTPKEERLLERLQAGEAVELPLDLDEEATRLLSRERKRWRGELRGRGDRPPFRRQLGTLAEKSARGRELTIADWRRNVRKAARRGQ
jgi:hypothetical protein